jgi:hypothetical protein
VGRIFSPTWFSSFFLMKTYRFFYLNFVILLHHTFSFTENRRIDRISWWFLLNLNNHRTAGVLKDLKHSVELYQNTKESSTTLSGLGKLSEHSWLNNAMQKKRYYFLLRGDMELKSSKRKSEFSVLAESSKFKWILIELHEGWVGLPHPMWSPSLNTIGIFLIRANIKYFI